MSSGKPPSRLPIGENTSLLRGTSLAGNQATLSSINCWKGGSSGYTRKTCLSGDEKNVQCAGKKFPSKGAQVALGGGFQVAVGVPEARLLRGWRCPILEKQGLAAGGGCGKSRRSKKEKRNRGRALRKSISGGPRSGEMKSGMHTKS